MFVILGLIISGLLYALAVQFRKSRSLESDLDRVRAIAIDEQANRCDEILSLEKQLASLRAGLKQVDNITAIVIDADSATWADFETPGLSTVLWNHWIEWHRKRPGDREFDRTFIPPWNGLSLKQQGLIDKMASVASKEVIDAMVARVRCKLGLEVAGVKGGEGEDDGDAD